MLDAQLKRLVRKIHDQSTEFVDYTNFLNQNCRTDKMAERIVKTAEEIKVVLDKRYESVR